MAFDAQEPRGFLSRHRYPLLGVLVPIPRRELVESQKKLLEPASPLAEPYWTWPAVVPVTPEAATLLELQLSEPKPFVVSNWPFDPSAAGRV